MIRPHLLYLRTVLRHKLYVYQAGRKLGVGRWQLLVHDLSKFSRAEWAPYVRRFAKGRAGAMDHADDPNEWQGAWHHHWMHNSHHWEHWLDFCSAWNPPPGLEMPEKYAREMVADWTGASRAYTGKPDCSEWYSAHRDKMVLHPNTRALVERLIYTEAKGS